MAKKNVVVIGGGTGTVAVLRGLKKYDDLNLSVIVSMTDDGGSNAVVRDEFGLLPLSDLRKSIIALSGSGNGILRDVFTYRFEKGDGLKGHTLGNLIMMGLTEIEGDELGSIEAVSRLFNVKGKILPVTLDDVRLKAEYEGGGVQNGEHLIDEPPEKYSTKRIEKLSTVPVAKVHPEVIKVIEEADYIIAGPGDLYTSIMANIIVPGVPEAIQKSKAKFVFIGNLMTKKGQTHGMRASDLVEEITKYAGREPNIVLENHKAIPEEIVKRYKKKGEDIILDDLDDEARNYKVIRASLISDVEVEKESGDDLVRSLIRHDSVKVGKILYHKVIKPKKLSFFK